MQIRDAFPQEASSIHKVLKKAFFGLRGRGYPDQAINSAIKKTMQIREHISSGKLVLVADLDGRIIGTVTGVEMHGTMQVNSLAVIPSHQRHGIGCKLLEYLECKAREKKCNKLFLLTGWAMIEAIYLYKKLGFRREGYLHEQFHGADLIAFGKSLTGHEWSRQSTSESNQPSSWFRIVL